MRSNRQRAFIGATAAILLTVACNTTRLVDDTGDRTWTSVAPDTAVLDAIGATRQLTVVDDLGAQVAVPALTWRTLDAASVQIDATGLATAVAPGIGRVVVETSQHADTATIEVFQAVATLAISPTIASVAVGAISNSPLSCVTETRTRSTTDGWTGPAPTRTSPSSRQVGWPSVAPQDRLPSPPGSDPERRQRR